MKFRLCLPVGTVAFVTLIAILSVSMARAEKPESPRIKVSEGGESHLAAGECRKMVVGPGVNQPDPFPGYGGFVGWECPTRLRDGTMLVTFSAGYWHASLPTPFDPEWMKTTGRQWRDIGMPDVEAPTGGRAMVVRSTDNGVTWSRPETLLDSPFDDRHPAVSELSDGTLLCSLFTYPSGSGPNIDNDPAKMALMGVVRSLDGGKTWEQTLRRMPRGFMMSATDGPPLELADGSILLAGEAQEESGRMVTVVYRSTDRGATWRLLSKVPTDHNQHEPSLAQLKDGTLVIISRPEGAIAWSHDDGRTWTDPVTFGIRMYAPTLQVLKDGTLLCHYGSYNHKRLRAIFSTDGGHTWVAAGKDRGFLIDRTYGYSRSCLMPDGSVYLAYIGTGGHRRTDAENNMIWSIRLRVRDDHSGIELRPVDPNASGETSLEMPDPGKPIRGI